MSVYYSRRKIIAGAVPLSGEHHFIPAISTARQWISTWEWAVAALLYGSGSRYRWQPEGFKPTCDLDVFLVWDPKQLQSGATHPQDLCARLEREVKARHYVTLSIELVKLDAIHALPRFRRGPGYLDHLRLVCASPQGPELLGKDSPLPFLEKAGCFLQSDWAAKADEALGYLELQETALKALYRPENLYGYHKALHRVMDAPVHIARRVTGILDQDDVLRGKDDAETVRGLYARLVPQHFDLFDRLHAAKGVYCQAVRSFYAPPEGPGPVRLLLSPEQTGQEYDNVTRYVILTRVDGLRRFIEVNRELLMHL